jgi:hypothetical protein
MWGRGEGLAVAAVAAAVVVSAAPAPALAPATPQQNLRAVVEQVSAATAVRYDTTDDRGVRLDGLKVIQRGSLYLGVSHALISDHFQVRLSTSTDLIQWTYRATLDGDAAQPTIAALPGGGYLVAYEKASTADLLPLVVLPSQLGVVSGLLGRIQLRFRHYPSLDRLQAASPSRTFTAPRQLSRTAEGTPDIIDARLTDGLAHSRITVGIHYFKDVDGDGFPDVDREAEGVLTDFKSWRAHDDAVVNSAFQSLATPHEGFSGPPQGNFGDRDEVVLEGAHLRLYEAQYVAQDFSSWRLFMYDVASRSLTPLAVATSGGSHAFGNPTVTALVSPAGRPALLVTMIVFSEGSAPGEAGELVFYREL